MALDFGFAARAGGECKMRFDDTNPAAESTEYVQSILDTVHWLGHAESAVTYSSDYFQELYDLAEELINRGHAYVCFQTQDQMSKARRAKEDSPWRGQSKEETLALFRGMRDGRFAEGECSLRMRMDMNSPNPVMRDLVAYRILYTAHHRTGDKWCIYPSYDFTHCLVDSLENISHSLCTLEFVPRRESYMWLLHKLGMYTPVVWEFARLSITRTVMSKRKLM